MGITVDLVRIIALVQENKGKEKGDILGIITSGLECMFFSAILTHYPCFSTENSVL